MVVEKRDVRGILGKVFGYEELVLLAEAEEDEVFLKVVRSEDDCRPIGEVEFVNEVSTEEVLVSPSDYFLVRGRVVILYHRNSEGKIVDFDLYGDEVWLVGVDGTLDEYPHGEVEECPSIQRIRERQEFVEFKKEVRDGSICYL